MHTQPALLQERIGLGIKIPPSGRACLKRAQGWGCELARSLRTAKTSHKTLNRVSAQQDAGQGPISPPAWVSSPIFFLLASSGFTAITTDLFNPIGSRWLLNNIDMPTHIWVVDHLSKFVRDMVFEIGVSNISIVLGCLGWALCSSILLNDAIDERSGSGSMEDATEASTQLNSIGSKNFKRLIAVWTLYFTAGGFLLPGDNLLVSFFKHMFNRVRPSTRHKSFSFPSGHTTAVTYIVGILLFAMLPYVLELLETRRREPNKAAKLGVLNNEGVQKVVRTVTDNSGKLWGFAVASTAGGRILGDVHWVTDTMAGACLGSAIVSGYLIISTNLQSRRTKGDSSNAGS